MGEMETRSHLLGVPYHQDLSLLQVAPNLFSISSCLVLPYSLMLLLKEGLSEFRPQKEEQHSWSLFHQEHSKQPRFRFLQHKTSPNLASISLKQTAILEEEEVPQARPGPMQFDRIWTLPRSQPQPRWLTRPRYPVVGPYQQTGQLLLFLKEHQSAQPVSTVQKLSLLFL